MKKTIAAATLATALLAGTALAAAQEVTLKIADSLPAEHIITKNTTDVFMKRVKEELGDRVAFQHFPAEQLGKAKDLLTITQSGIADIGYVVPSYVSEKMPLGAVAELPGEISNSCEGSVAFYEMAHTGGLLNKLEFEPNGVRVLYNVALSPYQAIFSKRADVNAFDRISGKKIRANPGPMELSLEAIGGVPVRMTPPEIYDAMTKGTIDGALLPFTSTFSYGVDQVVGSATRNANFGTVGVTFAISLNRWNALPNDVKEVLDRVGGEVTRSACKAFDEAEGKLADQLKGRGATMIVLDDVQKQKLHDEFAGIAKEWADNLDGRGLKGTEVLKAFREHVSNVDE